MRTPEQLAHQNIDALLTQCGWIVQSRHEMNLGAGRGVAVREFPLKTGYADYLLFADRRAIGSIEVKAEGATLTANLARAERLRQSILKRAFEGMLMEQDRSDDGAEKLIERMKATRIEEPNINKQVKKY